HKVLIHERPLEERGGTRASGGTSDPRWLPPDQADGAPWDAAADCHALGLVLYRLLAGEHAFAGSGLRLAMQAARRGAPPLREELARALPPGLQSYCLKLLAPDPRERPGGAREVATRLEGFAVQADADDHGDAPSFPIATGPGPLLRAPTRAAAPKPPPARRPRARWLAPLVVAVLGPALAYVALQNLPEKTPDEPTPKRAVDIRATAPLDASRTSPDDCATCHPRQTNEWQRSVMGQSARSPLFQALEILIEEQVGRSDTCLHGAGILRAADPSTACRVPNTGFAITGSGGPLWCVNCHAPLENLRNLLPRWDGVSAFSSSRQPVRDLLSPKEMSGIDCAFCHQVHGPVQPGDEARGRYEGNPFWTSVIDGQRFAMRPEDSRGVPGIANSGYQLDPAVLIDGAPPIARTAAPGALVTGDAHRRPSVESRAYLNSSQFCGACHDVRIFGSDALGISRGEHFKRLRNAYSEWVDWSEAEARAGRRPASCQDCHMSLYPGVCVPGDADAAGLDPGASALRRSCPSDMHFEARPPGARPLGLPATSSGGAGPITTHYFSGVDVPLAPEYEQRLVDEAKVDDAGVPLGAHQRRDALLGMSFRFELEPPRRQGDTLEIPVVLENTGAGHKIPAGFSQEREFWVHLRVTDARGDVVYEVGRVDRNDEDLRDKVFLRVNTDESLRDGAGRPLGVFGADVTNGPDHPEWSPPPELGGTEFRGHGLINLQNGFLRCVRCIGFIDSEGECQAFAGQSATRAARFDDGDFDVDTGECRSNLFGRNALFEVYFPVGSLDATRGVIRGPDAIIDTRSASPNVPQRYTYTLPVRGRPGPFTIEARLMFRAFPPFLLRAFIDYERRKAAEGLRPSGPVITEEALARLDIVELHSARAELP
ncbi:MAG: hypothetical protein KC636_06110, partial [Myxococcales bacterium]|nr:hypothetical protein [Myxococcales bacterium]